MKVSLPVAQAMAQPSQPLPSADLALLRLRRRDVLLGLQPQPDSGSFR